MTEKPFWDVEIRGALAKTAPYKVTIRAAVEAPTSVAAVAIVTATTMGAFGKGQLEVLEASAVLTQRPEPDGERPTLFEGAEAPDPRCKTCETVNYVRDSGDGNLCYRCARELGFSEVEAVSWPLVSAAADRQLEELHGDGCGATTEISPDGSPASLECNCELDDQEEDDQVEEEEEEADATAQAE